MISVHSAGSATQNPAGTDTRQVAPTVSEASQAAQVVERRSGVFLLVWALEVVPRRAAAKHAAPCFAACVFDLEPLVGRRTIRPLQLACISLPLTAYRP
jgi:hypothetical protein